MYKRFSVIFILVAFVFAFGFSVFNLKTENAIAEESDLFEIQSKSAYLMDYNSGEVIFAKNENDKLPIASMCKIMTLLLTFENIDSQVFNLDSDIFVSENASAMGGSQIFLEANTNYNAKELIKGIVVASANDACVAFAEKISGSEENFVKLMNAKAKELGMENTNFVNCTGLPKVGQYSTAKDVSKMFCELIKHKDYFEFSNIWMDKIDHPKGRITEISNTNKLIRFYEGCDCGKTGYTGEAGHCLCASAIKNGMRIISVVISSPNSKTRFKEVSEMFDYAFNNYVNKLIIDNTKPLDIPVIIENGKQETVSVIPEKPLYIFSGKNEKVSVDIDFIPFEKIKAPISKGEPVGELKVYKDNKLYSTVNVLSNENVLKASFIDKLINIIKNWGII